MTKKAMIVNEKKMTRITWEKNPFFKNKKNDIVQFLTNKIWNEKIR
jgi:hypothetical protein